MSKSPRDTTKDYIVSHFGELFTITPTVIEKPDGTTIIHAEIHLCPKGYWRQVNNEGATLDNKAPTGAVPCEE